MKDAAGSTMSAFKTYNKIFKKYNKSRVPIKQNTDLKYLGDCSFSCDMSIVEIGAYTDQHHKYYLLLCTFVGINPSFPSFSCVKCQTM
jgi:hypothetical protein